MFCKRRANIKRLTAAFNEIISDVVANIKTDDERESEIINRISLRINNEIEYNETKLTENEANKSLIAALDNSWTSILPVRIDSIKRNCLGNVSFYKSCSKAKEDDEKELINV